MQITRRSDVLPAAEMAALAPILADIDRLKAERNAVVAAHNYMTPDIFSTADLAGDSLYLAQVSRDTEAEVIVLA
ncbi:MAG: quinolinate synthase NadA, partial [Acidimicrobiia bacterium]